MAEHDRSGSIPFPEETRQEAVAAYQAGEHVPALCHRFGIRHYHTLYVWLRRAGVPLRSHSPDYEHMSWARADWDAISRLNGQGLSDNAISRQLGICASTARKYRILAGLPMRGTPGWAAANAKRSAKAKARTAAVALALMLLAGGAQAQGWQGHPHQVPDPFADMLQGNNKSCCSSADCAYTESCVTAEYGDPGVYGPDGLCHTVTDEALRVKHCAPGGVSACFYAGKMLCACLDAS